ncbi:MAG: HEAT repeat domain-containing protein, partial [bacterium]
MSAYVHENKEEDVLQFLETKIEAGKRVLLFNTNAPTPWILKDLRKTVEGLAADGKLTTLYVDLPPQSQRLIDEFLRTGQSSAEFLKVIATRFPPFLPREFHRPDLYENLLRAVYEHNLEARKDAKIKVVAYYQGRMLPPMPEQGQMPGRQGNRPPFPGGFPANNDDQDEFPRVMPRMEDLPFGKGMSLPPLPLTPGVREAFDQAVSEAKRNPHAVAIFIKPLDEFFPEELTQKPEVASILNIDKYTGFGPEKPENKLALYMSEQASPNQKSFVLPVLTDAPFYEESVNPGLPRGLRFNEFNAYTDLLLSTAGDGDDTFEPTPDELVPDEIAPFVPVGSRSELRSATAVKELHERRSAIKELSRIGEPAVGPLIEALSLPSLSVKLGAIQALRGIGDARAIEPIKQAGETEGLRDAAKTAVSEIRSKAEISTKHADVSKKTPSIPQPSAIYSSFDEERSYAFFRALLKEAPLVVDIDAETLISKENGKVELSGWGFVEAIKALERKLPGELTERIRIRVVNLNPALNAREIQRAFAITPELRGMIEITDVPVRHQAFKGLGVFLEKDALKIAAEKNRELWKDQLDILVKKPGANEVIDGRKLFLAALLHHAVGVKLSERLRIAAVKLLQELGIS